MRKKSILSSLIFIVALPSVLSQQKSDSASINLSDIEVNASRNKLYSEMGRLLTVIDKAEIVQIAVQSLDQLLDFVSGIDIRQRGTNGTQADISVRGGTFDQVLVLLNGVNITDPQTGHFNLDIPLNLSDISRVEILQGSSARLLGPNAFSGAINIVTENYKKRALNAELVVGSFNYFAPTVSGSLGTNRFRTFASVSHKSSSGYITNTDFDLTNAFIQSALNFRKAGKFDFQVATQLKDFGANGFYSLKFLNQRENSKIFLSSLKWALSYDGFSYNAQVYWRRHHDRFELDHNNPAGFNYHLTDVTGGKVSASKTGKFGKTTVGFDFRNELVFSNALGLAMDSLAVPFEKNVFFTKKYNRLVTTGLIDHSVRIGNWYLSLGVASTFSADFNFSNYGGMDIGYSIADNVKIYTSVNSATRLPTFTDLFLVNSNQKGNPDLKPEQSKTLEIGTNINSSTWKLNGAIFYRIGQNVIDWIKLDLTSIKYEASNLASVNASGADFSVEYNFQQSFLKRLCLAYSYLQLDKSAIGFDSKYALDYLKNKLTMRLDHSIGNHFSASWKVGYFDRSGNYDANTVLGSPTILKNYISYFIFDGRLIWSQKKYLVFADLNNIYNSSYADIGGLTLPGRSANIGLRLKLN